MRVLNGRTWFSWNLKTCGITDILLPLIQEKKTGILIFKNGDLKKRSILQKVKKNFYKFYGDYSACFIIPLNPPL